MAISLNKYSDLGELEYTQVDENWTKIEADSERATVAELYSQDNDKIVGPETIKDALGWDVHSSSGGAFTWDFNGHVNNKITISGNPTFEVGTPSTPGKACLIDVIGNNATQRTVTFSAGFIGQLPAMTDVTNTRGYLISVVVRDATTVFASAMGYDL